MNLVLVFLKNFIKKFIVKHITTAAMEKVVIILLGALVKRTDSKVDDELYKAVFGKTSIQEEEKK